MLQTKEDAQGDGKQSQRKRSVPGAPYVSERVLALAYLGWIPLAMFTMGLVFASIPGYFIFLHVPSAASGLAPADPGGQITKSGIQELQAWGFSLDGYAAFLISCDIFLVAGYLGMATLLFWHTWRGTRDWMALCASYTLALFPVQIIRFQLWTLPPAWSGSITLLSFLGTIGISLFGGLFPGGRFVPRWTGLLALGSSIVWGVYLFVPAASEPSSMLATITFLLILASFGCLGGIQVYRYRQVSNQVQRQQSKWVFFGLGSMASGMGVWTGLSALLYFQGMFVHPLVRSLFLLSQMLLLLLIPLGIGFATLRYRLWDIDIIIKRTLVYSILTACVVGTYMLVVVLLGGLFHAEGNLLISLLATGLVAVLFHPLREMLQRGVNRLLYGQRDEPYHVISRLGQRLEATLAPDAVLPAIVETVAQALKLPYAAILFQQDQTASPVASYGRENGEPLLRLPLLYQRKPVGELLLAPRARGETFTPADRRLFADLARQVGIAAHAVQLTEDLQRSRERLVTTREEERRRLRRDLHDGLGPALASMTLKLDAARNLLTRDLAAADALLVDLKKQSQAHLADIRRLVYELRPPSLDELGLLHALREQAEPYLHEGLCVSLDAPEPLPELPAAVEVAIYRIVQEAITNVARHAQARTCTIRFTLDQSLDVEVCDDGRGIPKGAPAGVGLTSIRERVAELGGLCEIEAMAVGGTRIHVRLPLPQGPYREE